MIAFLSRFTFYNLLPSLIAGLATWILVSLALNILNIRNGQLRLPLLYTALVKSVLVLLGIGLILPVPRGFFAGLRAQAFPWESVLPFALVWLGIVLIVRHWFVQSARRRLVGEALPTAQSASRLDIALDRMLTAYARSSSNMVGDGLVQCCVPLQSQFARPELLISEELHTPMVLTEGDTPTILFPAGLVSRLEDDELTAALAHEYAHFLVRRPFCCSELALRRVLPVSPIAGLLATRLNHEEELACDDAAVSVLGNPEAFASMLVKSYRFTAAQRPRYATSLQWVPRLLGNKAGVSERVERLVQKAAPAERTLLQYGAACLAWFGVIFLFAT